MREISKLIVLLFGEIVPRFFRQFSMIGLRIHNLREVKSAFTEQLSEVEKLLLFALHVLILSKV